MELILQFIIIVIIAIIINNVKIGVALFLFYSFLVPYCKLGFGDLILQQNFINIIVVFSVWYKVRKLDVTPFLAFIVFYGLLLLEIPFCDGVSINYQIDHWRSSIMIAFCVPIAIWNLHYLGEKAYVNCRNILILAIITSCVYGIILTGLHGTNPYTMFFFNVLGYEYNLDWYGTDSRLFGRISSFFIHPMRFAFFLGCSLFYLYSIRYKISKHLFGVSIVLVSINIVTCGIRTILGAIFITASFFLLRNRNFKTFLITIILVSFIYLIINAVPELKIYYNNVMDISESSNISGSSLDMRLSQLQGCINEIQDCQFFGKGYMWHQHIMETIEHHPVILAFESLIFVILCDNGYFGFFIYGLMTVILLLTQKKYIKNKQNRIILTCYLVFYYSYCIITGDYNYMSILFIFYYLTFSEMYISQYNRRLLVKESTH